MPHRVQLSAVKTGSAVAGPDVLRQLTPCSRTPVAPHLGGLARLVVYWKIRRPPAEHGRSSASSAVHVHKASKVNVRHGSVRPQHRLTWRLDLLGLVGPAKQRSAGSACACRQCGCKASCAQHQDLSPPCGVAMPAAVRQPLRHDDRYVALPAGKRQEDPSSRLCCHFAASAGGVTICSQTLQAAGSSCRYTCEENR
jgi:hypothetical protein